MRLRFEQQLKLGTTPIGEVEFDFKSRNGLMPVLRALQYVFKTPELNEAVFEILEKKIKLGVKNTGRYGMTMWEILVLGVVRLSEDADFDKLHDLANEHNALRGVLGVRKSDYTKGKKYHLQTIKDNVQQLDEATIYKISDIIVGGAHGLIKKKEGADSLNLRIKADSFVVESNIHFPTDLNLLWDSLRKSLETMQHFQSRGFNLESKCHCKAWMKKARHEYRTSSEIHRKKGGNYLCRLQQSVKLYLEVGKEISNRGQALITELAVKESISTFLSKRETKKMIDLKFYLEMVDKHIDLVHRRIILGEEIPHSEKVFSIFEEHVEWNSKGKVNKGVELGHNVLVATDQYHYILSASVYEQEVDKQQTIKLGNELKEKYGNKNKLQGISFDRNFYSLAARQHLEDIFEIVVLPKPGRKSKLELSESENPEYQKMKRAHSGVEGNINQLEQNGLDICLDKGIDGFKRYVSLGVLSYNLHRLGMSLVLSERKVEKNAKRRRARCKARLKAA